MLDEGDRADEDADDDPDHDRDREAEDRRQHGLAGGHPGVWRHHNLTEPDERVDGGGERFAEQLHRGDQLPEEQRSDDAPRTEQDFLSSITHVDTVALTLSSGR